MADYGPNALALAGVQPNVDMVTPMKTLAETDQASAHAQLFRTEAGIKNMTQNALQAYIRAKQSGADPATALDLITAVNPEMAQHIQTVEQTGKQYAAQARAGQIAQTGDTAGAANELTGFPQQYEQFGQGWNRLNDAQKAETETHLTQTGSAANAVLKAYDQFDNGKITSEELKKVWNDQLTYLYQNGALGKPNNPQTRSQFNMMYNSPNRQMAEQLQMKSTTGHQYLEDTGQSSGAKKRAELPPEKELVEKKATEERQTQQEKPLTVPAGTTTITTGRRAFGGVPAPGAPGSEAETIPQPPPTTGPGATIGSDLPEMSVPKMPIAKTNQMGGVGGESPDVVDLKKDASKDYMENTVKPARLAYGQRAQLQEMENLLQNPNVKSSVLADTKAKMAGWIYALMGEGPDGIAAAKKWTGVDLASQGALNKASTQMGLQYARATEGAREAVQAIRIALGANPSTENPREINQKIIKMMQASNQWAIDRYQYGTAYYNKNQHYVNSDSSFLQQRPMELYMSRVEPMVAPPGPNGQGLDSRKMIPNAVYMIKDPKTGATHNATWVPGKGLVEYK